MNPKQTKAKGNAATKIQSAWKGKKVRNATSKGKSVKKASPIKRQHSYYNQEFINFCNEHTGNRGNKGKTSVVKRGQKSKSPSPTKGKGSNSNANNNNYLNYCHRRHHEYNMNSN